MADETKPASKKKVAKPSRIDTIVAEQEKAIESFATFIQKSAEMTLQGNFNPSGLLVQYSKLWKDWAKQLTVITREVLRD